jgi:hypothetical protein
MGGTRLVTQIIQKSVVNITIADARADMEDLYDALRDEYNRVIGVHRKTYAEYMGTPEFDRVVFYKLGVWVPDGEMTKYETGIFGTRAEAAKVKEAYIAEHRATVKVKWKINPATFEEAFGDIVTSPFLTTINQNDDSNK